MEFSDQATADRPRRPLSALERRSRTRKLWAALVIVAIVALSITIYALMPQAPSGPPPSIQVTPSAHNFGDIPPELVSTTFTVENVGQGDLVLQYIATSCMCTSAIFSFSGRNSPTFGMHDNPTGWSETLKEGESGELIVTYDPNVHPDTGPIERAVYVGSNDPATREVEVTITANVVRG
ncbi:MAG: hypothetical protein V3U52_03475 [Thermoplasmata archaeon]